MDQFWENPQVSKGHSNPDIVTSLENEWGLKTLGQGVDWIVGDVPTEKYVFKLWPDSSFEALDSTQLPWQPADSAEEEIECLLRWIFEYYVQKTADGRVILHEYLHYIILEHTLHTDPWCVRIHLVEVPTQQKWHVVFQLASDVQ